MNPNDALRADPKTVWASFAPLAAATIIPAGHLVAYAGISRGSRVLDVACGTGVVAITAARQGAQVTGFDLTPELLAVARTNAATANVTVDWHEGDVEQLPFPDASFDVVVSQFGHMFAPHPDQALGEMLRVLKSGGTIAFSTWPPELYVGRMFALMGRYLPPPPPGAVPPTLWGDPNVVRERLGARVQGVRFDRRSNLVPALSPEHFRDVTERTAGPLVKLVETLSASQPETLARLRQEHDALTTEYVEDNALRQDYLLTRATKV